MSRDRKRVVVVSAHPDDETLGCGGALLRHVASGDEVSWVIATAGWEPKFSAETLALKSAEIDRVADAYGFHRVIRLGLPTTRLRELPGAAVIEPLEAALAPLRADWLYTVFPGDIHTDHHAVFEALTIIFKPFRTQPRLERFACFETLSSTDAAPPLAARAFVPNTFVDITPHIDRKVDIMAMFASERQQFPQPRSSEAIRALARYRGATVGCQFAEAFMLMREVV